MLPHTLHTSSALLEDLESGAYAPGADPETDRAIRLNEGLNEFLTQSQSDPTAPDAVFDALRQIYDASA